MSGKCPFVPPRTLSICDKNTRKNDKLSHLPAFPRRSQTESPPRSDPEAGCNRPHQSRSKRLFRYEDTPRPHPFIAFSVPPEILASGKAELETLVTEPPECLEGLIKGVDAFRSAN